MKAGPVGFRRFRVEASHDPGSRGTCDGTINTDITVAHLARWVASALARGAVPGAAVGLEVKGDCSHGTLYAPNESDVSLEDLCLCMMQIDGAETARMRSRILHAKRRNFNGRPFLLWVEDAPERSAVFICACDEATWTRGCLEVDNATLGETLGRIAYGRLAGLAAELGLSPAVQGGSLGLPKPVESFHGELLGSILDSVCFDVNRFGDEWSIRVPCLTSDQGYEEAPDANSNEPALLLTRRSCSGPSKYKPEHVGAGPMPASALQAEASFPKILHHRHPLVHRLPKQEQDEVLQSRVSWRVGSLSFPQHCAPNQQMRPGSKGELQAESGKGLVKFHRSVQN